jgi:hypothetical protein
MATTRGAKVPETDLQYAEEVMEVYRLGDTPVPRSASPSLRRLYEWVQNPENYDTFIKTTVKQATDILAKHRQPQESDFIVTAERKSVSELQEFLRQHISESQSQVTHEPSSQPRQTWVAQRPATLGPSVLAGGESQNQNSGEGD